MQTAVGFRKATLVLVSFALLAVLAAQTGCNSNASPTAVAPPPPPTGPDPMPVITSARVDFGVNNPDGKPGELLFDDRPIWTGPVVAEATPGWLYIHDAPFEKELEIASEYLTPGVHTLKFRIQGSRASNYSLSGNVQLKNPPYTQYASWHGESAWLKTGTEWSYEVIVP